MIRKLLLIRLKHVSPEFLKGEGFKPVLQFIKDQAGIPVSPEAWADEQGLSHYAFKLENMKLKDYEAVKKWYKDPATPEVLLHDYEDNLKAKPVKYESDDDALKRIGLKINKAALEE